MSNDKNLRPTFDRRPATTAEASGDGATKSPRPIFGQKADRAKRPPNAIFNEGAQAIIDGHLKAVMGELEAAGVKPVGIVAGVLHDGETSVNWCVSDEVEDDDGRPLTSGEVAREIATDIERSTAGR